MHELHLINDLMEDLICTAKKEDIKKITKLYVTIGKLTEITPETFRFHFEQKSKNTIAEGAEIVITPSTVREIKLNSFDGE